MLRPCVPSGRGEWVAFVAMAGWLMALVGCCFCVVVVVVVVVVVAVVVVVGGGGCSPALVVDSPVSSVVVAQANVAKILSALRAANGDIERAMPYLFD